MVAEQDALRTFLQPIKSNDHHIDFFTIYKKEATEYDADYIKKYDEDLNTTPTLISVRCLLLNRPDTPPNALSLKAVVYEDVYIL